MPNKLNKLILTNFQQHEYREIEFDPYVTVIKGRNGTGKTTIFRALRWICLNKGKIKNLIKHNNKFTEAELHLGKHIIIRHGGNENTYTVDGEIFRSFKTNPPDDVANIVNVSEDNFQGQMDGPFWFMETAGQVSKEMNQIINMEVMDKTLGEIDSRVRRAKFNVESTSEALEKAKEERDRLSWVDEADEDLFEIESLEIQRANLERDISRLKELVTKFDWFSSAKKEKADRLKDLKALLSKYQKTNIQAKLQKIARLKFLVNKVEVLERKICLTKESLQHVQEQSKKMTEGKCPLCKQPLPVRSQR